MFENLRRIICEEIWTANKVEQQPIAEKKEVKVDSIAAKVVDNKLADDIAAIKKAFPGANDIEISLQDLLKIAPRRRERTDAYKGLVKELEKEGIELKITSRKKNKKEA